MFGLGAGELFLIFMIAVMFFGPKKIPELAKGVGEAIREFQNAKSKPDVVDVEITQEKKSS